MEFTRESLAQEVDKQFGALTLTDAPGGPIELHATLRLSTANLGRLGEIAEQIDALADRNDEESWDAARQLFIDRLALVADRPDALREYVANDDIATLRVLTKAWRDATQGESEPQ